MNNKGFTLIELLAVLVILTVIMGIALPSISSSMERSKDQQDKSRKKVIVASAELYITDKKNAIYKTVTDSGTCKITLEKLTDRGYLSHDETLKSDNKNQFKGYILFDRNNYQIVFCDTENPIDESTLNESSSDEDRYIVQNCKNEPVDCNE